MILQNRDHVRFATVRHSKNHMVIWRGKIYLWRIINDIGINPNAPVAYYVNRIKRKEIPYKRSNQNTAPFPLRFDILSIRSKTTHETIL